jgi:hypothetical protein
MRHGWLIATGFAVACARPPAALTTERAADAVAFRAERQASGGDTAQHLVGHYVIHGNEIEVVVTSGHLDIRTNDRRLRDVQAGIATGGTPYSGGWNTPRLSSVRRVGELGLASDGSVRDTIRFVIKGTRTYALADYWLTFQLHGTFYSQRAGMWVEEVRWIHDGRRFTSSQ